MIRYINKGKKERKKERKKEKWFNGLLFNWCRLCKENKKKKN